MEIIGPEAVKFTNQKAEQQIELDKLYKQQEGFFLKLAQKQGKFFIILKISNEKFLKLDLQGNNFLDIFNII